MSVNLWQREQEFLGVIDAMMTRGVKVDIPFCRRKIAEGDVMLNKLLIKLDGKKPTSSKDLKTMLVDELGLPVVKYTTGGKSGIKRPSFDKAAMAEYDQYLSAMDSDLAQDILAYRGWQKTTSTNYRAYNRMVSPDGRLRCNYDIGGTRTGRLSCSAPNLQNIPKFNDTKPQAWNWDVKKAFVPKSEEYSLLEVDFSQLEFRLAAAYSQEPSLVETFNDITRDIFSEMAEELGFPRQYIKVKVYAGNYGAQPEKIAQILNIPLKESQKLHWKYIKTYPQLFALSENVNERAKARGYITYWTGRRRHFENRYESRKAFNSLLQGGGAEVVKSAMIRVFNGVDSPDCRMLLQVHDSIVFEVLTSRLDYFKTKIMQLMSDVTADSDYPFSHILSRVAFPVEAKLWGT